MFIKLIEIYAETNKGLTIYRLREAVVNKKYVISMIESERIRNTESGARFPEGLTSNQKYTDMLVDTGGRSFVYTVVGELDHIYKLFETDSMLNHRQTLKG
jgi:hypothetical protein